MTPINRVLLLLTLSALVFSAPAAAEDTSNRTSAEQASARGLPAESATSHVVTLGDEKVSFTVRAGAIRLRDAKSEAPQADVAYVSYERTGVDPQTRPVAFVFNGGPGAASAWLALGVLSPWRLRFSPETVSPSAPPVVVDNAESWLSFSDLVFIDPPGTGFSKILAEGEDARKQFFSVQGDADALAVVIRKWLTARARLGSPKYLVGESYGGFRCARLVGALRAHESIGVSGLLLVSPALDFAWLLHPDRNPLARAALLPSFAAIVRGARERGDVADVEAYAAGEYVTDSLKGAKDTKALARMSDAVAGITGLDPRLTSRLGGRIDAGTFARERAADQGRVLSVYDGQISGYAPNPFSLEGDSLDPLLESWRAPLGAAMTRLVLEKFNWPIGDARYVVLNPDVSHRWQYDGDGRDNAEVVSALREALALDPRLRLLVVHGLYDLTTPYFATKLILDQLPEFGDPTRVRLLTFRGGHMPYLYDESRKAMRDSARGWMEGR